MFVTCFLQGGLGNQLFIIFTTIATAIKNKCDYVIIYQDSSPSITPRKTYFESLLSKIKTHDMYRQPITKMIKEESHMIYNELPSIQSNTMLSGYFQSRKYFDNIRDFINDNIFLSSQQDKRMLAISKDIIKQKMKNDDKLIFIHVRRGDYVNLSHYHYNLTEEYYKEAIETHKNKYNCFFVCFSDDIEYSKNMLGKYIEKDKLYFPNMSKDYIELILMSEMDGAIIANSSFSWWGAYLMEIKKEKQNISPFIVGPKQWYTEGTEDNSVNDRNVERPNWLFL
jgi:hypothetical protein